MLYVGLTMWFLSIFLWPSLKFNFFLKKKEIKIKKIKLYPLLILRIKNAKFNVKHAIKLEEYSTKSHQIERN